MKLEQLANAYVHLERQVNNSPRYSKFALHNGAEKKYRPQGGDNTIDIPYKIRHNATLLTASPDSRLFSELMGDGVRLYTHPQFTDYWPDGVVKAAPTASTRTVLAERGYFIKLHFPTRISRFNRRLRASSVRHSLEISQDIEDSRGHAPLRFAFLPESIGITVPEDFGCIIREATPRPVVNDARHLIPFFSLYSTDSSAPTDPPLLTQLIDRSAAQPLEFLLEKIVHPLIECWTWCARERGLLLESHCQNTLLEVDEEFTPRRIVHRDFQSIVVDKQVRAANGLNTLFKKHIIGEDEPPVQQEYSLVYDYLVSGHIFPHLSECLQKHYGVPQKKTDEAIKGIFRELFPNSNDFFPPTTYGFSNKISDDNSVQLEDTHERPRYR